MKKANILFAVALFMLIGSQLFSQELPQPFQRLIEADDAKSLSKVVTKKNINDCFGHYSMLGVAIKQKAADCIDLLLSKGADINLICENNKSPLLFACKYGTVELVKKLIEQGADINVLYDNQPAEAWARAYNKKEIADYIENCKKETKSK